MLKINPNILNEGNQLDVLEIPDYDNTKSYWENELEIIVRCNNCGKPTKYGNTRMCSGFVGCDNKILINNKEVECYFGDLLPRILEYKENQYEKYIEGKVYRYRDGNTEYYE